MSMFLHAGSDPMADEILRLRERIHQLEEAVNRLLDNPPCSDPDCCEMAIAESEARTNLWLVLNTKQPKN